MSRLAPDSRADYRWFRDIPTRWADNDIYGHVNNSVYHFWVDTVVNGWLVEAGLLDVGRSATVGLVVENGCSYFAPLAFPDVVTAGLRVARIGRSSVRYEIGLFAQDSETTAARAHFVHVYVDEKTRRPVPISAMMRKTLGELQT